MRKKILTRANAVIIMLLGALGFASCEHQVKYGPEPDPVLYGPVPLYGVPAPEEVQEVPSESIVEDAE